MISPDKNPSPLKKTLRMPINKSPGKIVDMKEKIISPTKTPNTTPRVKKFVKVIESRLKTQNSRSARRKSTIDRKKGEKATISVKENSQVQTLISTYLGNSKPFIKEDKKEEKNM